MSTNPNDPSDVSNFKDRAMVLAEGRRQLDERVAAGSLSGTARYAAEALFVALEKFADANSLDVADTTILMINAASYVGMLQGALDANGKTMTPLALAYIRGSLTIMQSMVTAGRNKARANTEASFADFDKGPSLPPGGILQ